MKKQSKTITRPSPKEVAIATQMQSPVIKTPVAQNGDKMNLKPKTTPIKKSSNPFDTLLNQRTRDAATILSGDQTPWVQIEKAPNQFFPNASDFSQPFFILNAMLHDSDKAIQASRILLKCVLPDFTCMVSLPYKVNEETGEALFQDRRDILKAFETNSEPVGLVQFQKVDRGFTTAYYRLIFADQYTMEKAGMAESESSVETEEDERPF